jgi:hypothetical protein
MVYLTYARRVYTRCTEIHNTWAVTSILTICASTAIIYTCIICAHTLAIAIHNSILAIQANIYLLPTRSYGYGALRPVRVQIRRSHGPPSSQPFEFSSFDSFSVLSSRCPRSVRPHSRRNVCAKPYNLSPPFPNWPIADDRPMTERRGGGGRMDVVSENIIPE